MKLRLSPLFSDGVVLQRDMDVTVWGYALPASEVKMVFADEEKVFRADEDGRWQVDFSARGAGGPHTMEVTSEGETVSVKNILFGDVWICGGQSNMEMNMQRAHYMYPDELNKTDNFFIRQFSVQQNMDFQHPQDDLRGGSWELLSPLTVANFCAAGYFFAKSLYEKYKVPIGLIAAAVGGTPIHSWMSTDMLSEFPEAAAEAQKYSDDAFVSNLKNEELERTNKYFEMLDTNDAGLNERWYDPSHDDSNWSLKHLLNLWDDVPGTPGIDWFRKDIMIPAEYEGKQATLFLGTIVDADKVYFNGIEIGSTTYRYPPREYFIKSLPKGKSTLAIRVLKLNQNGGFTPGKQRLLVCENKCINLNTHWKHIRSADIEPFVQETMVYTKPAGLYNGMISPLHRYKIKGAIWYQGESDTHYPYDYCKKFESMVKGWRENWGYNFPFISTQLTHYGLTGGLSWNLLREQQLNSLSIPETGMVFTEDVGEHYDLHPLNKRDIGERLARVAMRLAYGEKMCDSPFEVCGLI